MLREHPLFRRVEPELLSNIMDAAELVFVPCGDTVYERRHFSRCLGVLLEGALQVRKESLMISVLRQGEVFGAAALFNGREDYPTTLTAVSDCRLILIPQESVRHLVRTCGAFAEDYVSYLSERIRFLSERLDAVSAEGGEGKLASYLLTAAGADGRVTLAATQLCQRIGVGRATLYRAFESLERAGAITRTGKTICIMDEEKLRALQARP